MLNVLLWLVTVEVIGLAAFPICYYLFPRLRDRGFGVSATFGILLIGYVSWTLSVLRIVPSVQLTIALLLLVMAGASGWYAWRRDREIWRFLVRRRALILTGQAVFLATFVVFVVYRAYDPAIDHTEQPMDFAFLNASIRSTLGPPEDPWLRGEAVSYYYFGYWMMGTLSKLTGIPSNITYNLSLALIPALGAMGIFGLVSNMVHADSRRLRVALAGGVAAAILLVAVANQEGIFEFMRANGIGAEVFWEWVEVDGLDGPAPTLTESWRPDEFYWWWRATRVIGAFDGDQLVDYTIHEFPFFSFILGDLHPHVMSIPFVVLFLTLCWHYLRSPAIRWGRFGASTYLPIGAMGLSLGGLAFTNMWDLPVFSAVVIGVAGIKAYEVHGPKLKRVVGEGLAVGVSVVLIALVLILPYLLTFTSQVSGIGALTHAPTRPLHMFIVWALFFVAVVPFVMGVFWRTTVTKEWGRMTAVSLLIGFSPYAVWAYLVLERGGTTSGLAGRLVHVFPAALLISVAVYSALWLVREARDSSGKVFALLLAALGLLLIMGPELLFVDDSFGGAHERMNTVFKLYYQGWIVLAAASGFALYYWRSLRESTRGWAHVLTHVWSAIFVVLLGSASYYTFAAAATKGDLFHEGATLDGLAFTNRGGGSEYRAIEYIREKAAGDSAVLEAVGGDYTPHGRISASTGVPTVLGWPGHEVQWRGSADSLEGRAEDVTSIYQTQDVETARDLLAKYDVDYVYVGPRERTKYGPDGLLKFATFMNTVFQDGDVVIYRVR